MFNVYIHCGESGRIERQKVFSGPGISVEVERYFIELCNVRTSEPAVAVLISGGMIKKSCRLDEEWEGERLTVDEPLAH